MTYNPPEQPPEPDDLTPDETGEEPSELEQLAIQLDTLENRVGTLEDFLAELGAGGPWCWRYLDRDQTRHLAEELRDWVDWLVNRYLLTNIPPCWFRHGNYVEELTALYVAWKAAYSPKVQHPNDSPINWHDRWLGPCMGRLTATACMSGVHVEPTPALHQTDLADFDAWLDEQDEAIPEKASEVAVAQTVADGRARRLLPDPTAPITLDGEWWTRRRETPHRLAPDWSRADQFTARRLTALDDHHPVNTTTGELRTAETDDWERTTNLAVRGMSLMRETNNLN